MEIEPVWGTGKVIPPGNPAGTWFLRINMTELVNEFLGGVEGEAEEIEITAPIGPFVE